MNWKYVLAIVIASVSVSAFVMLSDTENSSADTGSSGVTYTFDSATGTLTLSGTGEMDDYMYDHNAPWYSERHSIKKVVIGDDITSIGSMAFYDLSLIHI